MKKIKIIFIFFLLFIGVKNIKAFDNSIKVYDYAQVLSSSEEEKLRNSVLKYINKYNSDMILVTVKHHTKPDTQTYAKDFYNYNNFGLGDTKDGIIFVIDFSFNNIDTYVFANSRISKIYDNDRINNILNNITYKKENEYYNMFDAFIKEVSKYVSNSNDSLNSEFDNKLNFKNLIILVSIFIVSLIISSIIIIVLIIKNRVVKNIVSNDCYLKKGSLSIVKKSDNFITTHTSSTRIENS